MEINLEELKIKCPTTDDSNKALKNRPKSPINRNWNWSPRAPHSHHIIESINYNGDDHPLAEGVPYETIEASDKILPTDMDQSDIKNIKKILIDTEIAKDKTEEEEFERRSREIKLFLELEK